MDDAEQVDDAPRTSSLLLLPEDLLVTILSFFNANEIESVIKETCKSLHQNITYSMPLWRILCSRTGKISAMNDEDSKTDSCQHYRTLYFSTICVPIDRPTIEKAMEDTLQDRQEKMSKGDIVISLMPGIYNERVDIDLNSLRISSTRDNHIHVRIIAAYPELGASLVHCGRRKGENDESPCVQLITTSDSYRNRRSFHLQFENLIFLHSTKGANIWAGNCCARVDGPNALLSMKSCSVQSDSGRGIVVTGGASLNLLDSTVHDCAATGLYIGGCAFGLVQSSNILRNGFGTRVSDAYATNDTEDTIPQGHSGVYIEGTNAIIENSFLAGNSLSALSVVRGGTCRVRDCDLVANGSDPVLYEEANDVLLQIHPLFQNSIRGGIYDLGNNTLGDPVDNPCDFKIKRNLFRSPVPENISVSHLKMVDFL